MSEENKIEQEYSLVKKQLRENVEKAIELLQKANSIANENGTTISEVAPGLALELRDLLNDAGVSPEYQESWNSSQVCW